MWTKHLRLERPLRGEHKIFMEAEMRFEVTRFHRAYCMTLATFQELVQIVGPQLEKQATTFRDPVGAPA